MIHAISADVGECMQYLAHKYNDTTIRFILKYPGPLDPNILCSAAQAVIGNVDVLHASFIAKTNSAHWRVNAEYDVSDYFSLVDCDGDPAKYAEKIALEPVAHKAKCQLHVTQINGGDGCVIVVRISHLVVDGSDGKYLLNKLAESYRLIEETGTAEHLTVKNGSRSAMCTYKELSREELRSLMKKPFNGVKTEYPFASPDARGSRQMLHCTIPEDMLLAARQKAKHQGATVNDLMLTACCRSFTKNTNRKGTISISSMMDLRKHCKNGVSEGLANMSGGMSITLDYSEESDFEADLKNVVEQTTKIKSDPLAGLAGIPLIHGAIKIFPMWFLLLAADKLYSSLSLSITNLGNISCAPLEMNGLVPTRGIFGGPLKRKPSVQVGAASFDGTAELTILGDFTQEDINSLQTFLNGVKTELELYLTQGA